MMRVGKSFLLASICLAAIASSCLRPAPASADESALAPDVDMTATGSVKPPSDKSANASQRQPNDGTP